MNDMSLKAKIRNITKERNISTEDVITPGAEIHVFTDVLSEDTYSLWSYTKETVLAEKVETILSRGTGNTRPRDFYDVYMLVASGYEPSVFKAALDKTADHRGSSTVINNYSAILETLTQSPELRQRWDVYKHQMPYASEIEYEDTIYAIKDLMD